MIVISTWVKVSEDGVKDAKFVSPKDDRCHQLTLRSIQMDDQRPIQIFEQASKHAAGNLKKPCGKRSFAFLQGWMNYDSPRPSSKDDGSAIICVIPVALAAGTLPKAISAARFVASSIIMFVIGCHQCIKSPRPSHLDGKTWQKQGRHLLCHAE